MTKPTPVDYVVGYALACVVGVPFWLWVAWNRLTLPRYR
jgi:hypothetical protein